MLVDYIEFNHRFYKLRSIDFGEGWGQYFVGSTQLEKVLWDDELGYTSPEAESVDEQIFFFIETHWFKLLDNELRDKVLPLL